MSTTTLPSAIALRGMFRADGLRLIRDRFLLGMVVYIVGIAIVMRWALPWITSGLASRLAFDLTPWYPLLMGHFVVGLAGLPAGIVGGLLLLESREEGTTKAFLVTPVSLSMYVGVLSFVLFAASMVLILFQGVVIGAALPPWPAFLGAALAGAPAAPAFALFIAAFADDKIAAVAYMKVCAIAVLIPSASYFLPEPSQWLAAVYPPYWAAKAYWVGQAGGSGWPLWALGGLLLSTIWVALLGRMFLKAARK